MNNIPSVKTPVYVRIGTGEEIFVGLVDNSSDMDSYFSTAKLLRQLADSMEIRARNILNNPNHQEDDNMDTYTFDINANFGIRGSVRRMLKNKNIDFEEQWYLLRSVFIIKIDAPSPEWMQEQIQSLEKHPGITVTIKDTDE